MNTKPLFTALVLLGALSTPAFAQDNMKTKSDADKTKTKVDGMTTKSKVADDGKMKVKGKSDAGDKMKAKTMPAKAGAATTTTTTTTTTDMSTSTTTGAGGVMVGGAMMTPDKDIVDNAVGSADHTTLVAAVKAAGLVETLKGTGPFTVFAPTNEAFNKLPAGTVNSLLTPDMKPKLTSILTYHVVPGSYTAGNLKPGQVLTTVEGEQLTVMKNGNGVMIKDAKGGMARVTIPDVISSNGVTHVIDTVLMPAK